MSSGNFSILFADRWQQYIENVVVERSSASSCIFSSTRIAIVKFWSFLSALIY